MDGSDFHGDGDTVAEYHFPPDFKEYVLKELKYDRDLGWITRDKWVFWSEQDHEIDSSLSLDNCADFNLNVSAIPKVRDNIRRALPKVMQSDSLFDASLVQFWAATKTPEGRTKLTTQYEPFALTGGIDPCNTVRVCKYRMEMCRKYNCFYADAESGEEQLGLPGRVFRNQFPESIRNVEYYTTKEYPQRDLALRCKIRGSWAVPVFEDSSHTCVGVLEIVSFDGFLDIFSDNVNKIFQEFGLQCFDGCKICKMHPRGNVITNLTTNNRRTRVFQKLKTVMRLVCEKHGLPLAMAWVPCSACNGLESVGVEYCARMVDYCARKRIGVFDLAEFSAVSKCFHLRKGWVASRALSLQSPPDMLYFPSITKLSVDDYPLVPYARICKFSGWFIMCLRSNYTGDDIYVLEFFWPTSSEVNENIETRLNKLLGTMEDKLENFRFASGPKLGYLSSVEVIDVQNNKKTHEVLEIQATRTFSDSDPSTEQSSASVSNVYKIQATGTFFSQDSDPSTEQSSASVANTRLGFQDANMVDANMVTIKTEYDQFFDADPFSDYDPSSHSDSSFEQSIAGVANTRPGFQDVNMVTIKAKYASIAIVLKLSLPNRLVDLQQKVAERLKLEAGTYHVVHEDEEDGFVLIACDEDLQAYVDDSISQGNTSPVVLLQPKEPATNLNPIN